MQNLLKYAFGFVSTYFQIREMQQRHPSTTWVQFLDLEYPPHGHPELHPCWTGSKAPSSDAAFGKTVPKLHLCDRTLRSSRYFMFTAWNCPCWNVNVVSAERQELLSNAWCFSRCVPCTRTPRHNNIGCLSVKGIKKGKGAYVDFKSWILHPLFLSIHSHFNKEANSELSGKPQILDDKNF